MSNKKALKRAMFVSVLSLLMCVSMLVGTTFAWFTDSVTSGNNTIVAGNLDIVLEYKSNWTDNWTPVDANTKIFKEGALYEPGYTEVVFLRVSNAGSLALKYLLSLNIAKDKKSTNVYGEEFRISDYLYVGTYVQNEYGAASDMRAMFGDRESALNNVTFTKLRNAESIIRKNEPILPGQDTAHVVAIVLSMPETVGNEANTMPGVEAPSIELGVNLLATQYTYESDSFDHLYDAGASLETVHDIQDLETLQKAFEEGGQGRIVNMFIDDVAVELNEGKELALNMNTSTLEKKDDSQYAIVNRGDLTITGEGTIRSNMYGSIENHGNLYVDNLNIEVKGDKYGFHVKKGGVTQIKNLTLRAERGGVNVQYGSCVIDSADVEFCGYYDNANKKWLNGYLVYAGGEGCEVIINGGDFRYTGSNADKGRILCADDNAVIIVNGGTFGKGSTKVSSSWLTVADSNKDGVTGNIIIYGGVFQLDPSAFVAEGYQAVQGADGWWVVSAISG